MIQTDLGLSVIGLLCVALYIRLYCGSSVIALAAVLQIVVSFPMALAALVRTTRNPKP